MGDHPFDSCSLILSCFCFIIPADSVLPWQIIVLILLCFPLLFFHLLFMSHHSLELGPTMANHPFDSSQTSYFFFSFFVFVMTVQKTLSQCGILLSLSDSIFCFDRVIPKDFVSLWEIIPLILSPPPPSFNSIFCFCLVWS